MLELRRIPKRNIEDACDKTVRGRTDIAKGYVTNSQEVEATSQDSELWQRGGFVATAWQVLGLGKRLQ